MKDYHKNAEDEIELLDGKIKEVDRAFKEFE